MAERKPLREYLTFRFLDDVLLLPEGEYQKKIIGSMPNRIGPLVEYTLFDHAASQCFLQKSNTSEAQMLSKVLHTSSLPSSSFTSLNPLTIEFFRTPQTEAEFENTAWIGGASSPDEISNNLNNINGLKFYREIRGNLELFAGRVLVTAAV